ncbi:MAG: N-6 DNA methylase [Treponema sp.]|nr:N-6 DNA methylase [Candidatus Treponema merdequi]
MTLQEAFTKEQFDFSKFTQFTEAEIKWVEERIYQGTNENGDTVPKTTCIIREKEIELKPEEVVRQLYTHKLIEEYNYPKARIEFEKIVQMGRSNDKRADIVIYEDEHRTAPYIVVECKAPGKEKVKDQLENYTKNLGASIAVEVDGGETKEFYHNRQSLQNKNYKFEKIDRLPKFNETLDQILNDRFTIKDLVLVDEENTTSLKDVILEIEDKIFANFGGDVFEEVFKFLFAKLYDEYMSAEDNDILSHYINYGDYESVRELAQSDKPKVKETLDKFRQLEFRSLGAEGQVYDRVQKLFEKAQSKWKGIFPENTKFELGASDVKNVVSYLENVKLFNSNLDVVDDAFEHLMTRSQKAEKGQFFTPRYVIDMCVKMMNPSEQDKMIDTASGSCGFPMHTIFHVWNKINPEKHNFVNTKRGQRETDYVDNNVFAIDFDETCVRVGKMLNIIAGDGKTNVLELNTLDYNVWNGSKYLGKNGWKEKYYGGFSRLEELAVKKGQYTNYNFDLILANPPFAGDRSDSKVIGLYELGKDKNGKIKNNIGRDILFIERNLNFLKPGGRMGVVLPQGDFNNSSEKYLRDFIADKCRILGVVGLHGNTFLQHTGTKTSVLFVQKWTDENCGFPNICPKPKPDENGNIDYPIFFATMQEPTVNNQKEKIYVTENYVSWTKYSYGIKDGQLVTNTEPQFTDWKTTEFVKDLFIEDFGDLDNHKKWIVKPVTFEKKKLNKKDSEKKELKELKDKITLDEFLSLDKNTRKRYKEVLNDGKDCNVLIGDEIDIEEYKSFSKEKQKYFIPVEDVKERNNVRIKDTHGHIFVKHDLFNHDRELDNMWSLRDIRLKGRYSKDGITEAFEQFAKKENLSFFQ